MYRSRSGKLKQDPSTQFQKETGRWNTAAAVYAFVYVNKSGTRTTKTRNILALREEERCGIGESLNFKLLTLLLVLVMEIPVEDP